MKWLLDTNVVSESIRPRPDRTVAEWSARASVNQMAISVVTLAELQFGASLTKDARERERLNRWINEEVAQEFEERTLALTKEILTDWLFLANRLRAKGRPQSSPDLLLASTARIHDLIIVSRNAKDFLGTGLDVYDPWTRETHRMDEL